MGDTAFCPHICPLAIRGADGILSRRDAVALTFSTSSARLTGSTTMAPYLSSGKIVVWSASAVHMKRSGSYNQLTFHLRRRPLMLHLAVNRSFSWLTVSRKLGS